MDKKDGLRDKISDKKEEIQERISDTKEDIQEKASGLFKKLKRWFFILLGIAIVLSIITGAVAVFWNYSVGYRAGTPIKFSKKGYVFKTYEGQLSVGSLSNDGGGIGTDIWEFSVSRGDKEVIQAIENAVDNGDRVKLHYNEKLYKFSIFGDTKYFIKEVEIVDE